MTPSSSFRKYIDSAMICFPIPFRKKKVSSSFPLLKLPLLCIECVLINSQPVDIVNLSLTSIKCHQVIRVLNTSVRRIDVHIKKAKSVVWLVGDEGTGPRRYEDDVKEEDVMNDGRGFVFHFSDEREKESGGQVSLHSEHLKHYHFLSNDHEQPIKSSINYFKNLFKRSVGIIDLCSNNFTPSKCPFTLGLNSCDILQIWGDEPISSDELREIIEKTKATKMLSLRVPVDPDFHCDPIHFQAETVCLHSSLWVARDFLLGLNVSAIQLRNCDASKINATNFMELVDRWFHSTDRRLKKLDISWTEYPGKIDFEKYNPMKWCEKRRSKCYPFLPMVAVDLEHGYDIQRMDGTWATISSYWRNSLVFCVWDDMFPNLEGYEIFK